MIDDHIIKRDESMNKRARGCLEYRLYRYAYIYMYIGDYYTTQLYGDCHKLLQGSLLNNQYYGKEEVFF